MLDTPFIHRKIKLIQEDLAKLEPIAQLSFEDLTQDPFRYDATERQLERIVTRAIDINRHCLSEKGVGVEQIRTYQDTFLALAGIGVYPKEFAELIAPSAALRNVLVHEYDAVDPKQIYQSVGESLSQYARYCQYILEFLHKQTDASASD